VPAAGLAVLAMAVSGCGGLSMESPVRPGLEAGALPADPVRVLPPGPAAGSSQQQIVLGFLRAGAASESDYQVARSFLTPAPKSPWRPDSSVMVFTNEASTTTTLVDDHTVRLEATVVASIDASGRYRDLPAGSRASATFTLEQVSGQWRIDALPEGFGLWLSADDVDRVYRPFRLHYVSTTDRRLVPDLRWFSEGKGLATRLARAQLADAPEYLRGAARTHIPAGTRLTVDAVPVHDGLATVDLTSTRPGGEPVGRQNMWAQLVATLTQVPGVQRVALKVEGSDLELPGLSGPASSLADLSFPTVPPPPQVKPVLRSGSQLRAIDPELVPGPAPTAAQRPPVALPAIGPGWTGLALSRSGQEIAAVSAERTELARWRGDGAVAAPFAATGLTRPTYDRHDVLWVAGRDRATRVWAVNAAASPQDPQRSRPQAVSAKWLEDRVPLALRVAPGGQRLAVISTDPAGKDARIDVAGIVRAPNGIPQSLLPPLRVAAVLTTARDLVWADEVTLAVLGAAGPREAVRPWRVQVGGRTTALAQAPGAVAITTVNGLRGLVVTTTGNQVLLRAGSSWLPLRAGTDFAAPAT
jgi:hypothetical protein